VLPVTINPPFGEWAKADYVNSLQENLHGQLAGDEVGAELKALVEQCRTALINRADEND
jgi:hypothetical protein